MRNAERLRILHLIPYCGVAQGGPVANLEAITAQQATLGHIVKVITVVANSDGETASFAPGVEVLPFTNPRWGKLRFCSKLWDCAEKSEFDVIHSHHIWTDISRLAMSLSRSRRVPHLLTLCGGLAPKALRHRWWKKWPVRLWFQDRTLHNAHCLQAQSEIEYADIRRFGLRNPVAMIPAAVSVAGRYGSDAVTAEAFRSAFGLSRERQLVLYLGRLHPVKGLERLIAAWSQLREHHGLWTLVLAGPDEDNYRAVLKARIASASCRESVLFTGPLDNFWKWGALAAAQLFVMPSDFENFGIAIAEAMLCGLPVITTTGTPWRDLSAAGAGWWIEATTADLASALQEAMQLPDEARSEMGRKAVQLASRFSPEQVAADLVEVYRWLARKSPCPGCVREGSTSCFGKRVGQSLM